MFNVFNVLGSNETKVTLYRKNSNLCVTRYVICLQFFQATKMSLELLLKNIICQIISYECFLKLGF